MDLSSAARWIILAGIGLIALGGLLWLTGRAGLPIGRLPGDFHWESGGLTCFFPLASMILVSLILTLLLNVLVRLLNR